MPRRKAKPAIARVTQCADALEEALKGAKGAERVRRFLALVKHPKGIKAGQPFILAPWQDKEIVTPLYDTFRTDGTRQYRQGYISFARKSGKTTLAAGLGLYHTFADGEFGGEVYAAASSREQASLLFDCAASMVEASPILRARATVSRATKRIRDRYTQSVFRALSADVPHLHGLNASFVVLDEIAQQPNRDLYDVLATSTGARRQPLMLSIGTAGWDQHSIAYELYTHSRQLLSGSVEDPAFFALVKELPEGADWTDETLWPLANPGLGDFRDRDELKQACERAKLVPSQQNTFRNLYCNQWVSSETRWIDLSTWDDAPAPLPGTLCDAGLDLSSSQDITALVCAYPHEDDTFSLRLFAWLPEANLRERCQRDRVPYDRWAEQGLITLTPGNTVDYSVVEAKIRELHSSGELREVAFDPWNARDIAQRLTADGVQMVEFRQTLQNFAGPTKAFEKAVIDRRLRHDGNALLRWAVDCCTVHSDTNGNIRPVKPDRRKDARRIDPVVASIMALDRAMANAQSGNVDAFLRDPIIA
ncbi:MAG TPA: terminase TerL endonuclease subunit [Candidatus Nanoarchaeia archaeon]|nr:terminase TerL endonuclease subunit [Candidatus Nanoarchaeia archaeon]